MGLENRYQSLVATHSQCRKWVIRDGDEVISRCRNVGYALKAEVELGYKHLPGSGSGLMLLSSAEFKV